MTKKLALLACLAGMGAMAAMAADAAATTKVKQHRVDPHLVEQGKQVFGQFCVPCHQEEGKGKVGFAPSLTNQELLSIASDRFLSQTIHDGRVDTAMPPWATVLKPRQIKAVVAYLRSFAKTPNRGDEIDAEAPSQGDITLGQQRFEEICAACHGVHGEGYAAGGSGTAIGKTGFLSKASDGFIRATIETGRSDTPMHGFVGASGLAHLTDQEIDGVVAYLRSQQTK